MGNTVKTARKTGVHDKTTGELISPEEADRIRAGKRARQKVRRGVMQIEEAVKEIYPDKPLTEWDTEELAHGRPRNKDGNFRGGHAGFISRAVHEEAIRRFTEYSQGEMRGLVPKALEVVQYILEDTEVDAKGKPIVSLAVKFEAAKWTIEHLVGKPTQRVEGEISVRLQGLLASVMVNPGEVAGAVALSGAGDARLDERVLDVDADD